MQKIELGPVLNSQASAIWNKAKALGVTYAAFYADPDNSRQIIQFGACFKFYGIYPLFLCGQ